MDKLQIRPDPGDMQIISFANCMACFACVCNIAAIFVESLEGAACIIDCITDIIFVCVAGCMGTQISVELNAKSKYANGVANAGLTVAEPIGEMMVR